MDILIQCVKRLQTRVNDVFGELQEIRETDAMRAAHKFEGWLPQLFDFRHLKFFFLLFENSILRRSSSLAAVREFRLTSVEFRPLFRSAQKFQQKDNRSCTFR